MAISKSKGHRGRPVQAGIVKGTSMTANADLVLRDPRDIEQNVDFSEALQQARQQSDDFEDAHRVTGDLLKIEFCI